MKMILTSAVEAFVFFMAYTLFSGKGIDYYWVIISVIFFFLSLAIKVIFPKKKKQ